MRRSTEIMSRWKAKTQSGESLYFEACKGGYFSNKEEYGLKVVGKTAQDGTPTLDTPVEIQCVKTGTKIISRGKNLSRINVIDTSKYPKNLIYYEGPPIYCVMSYRCKGTATTPSAALSEVTYEDGNMWYGGGFDDGVGKRYVATLNKKRVIKIKYLNWANFSGIVYDIQVETGDTVTEFESTKPTQEITTPCDLYEGDIWYPMSGKVERKSMYKVCDGTENWVLRDDSFVLYPSDSPKLFIQTKNYSSHIQADGADGDTPYFITGDMTNLYCYNLTTNFPTLNDWKDFLAEQYANNTPVCFKLERAYPIIEQYDPQPISAPQKTAIVTQEPTDLTADLSATMLAHR